MKANNKLSLLIAAILILSFVFSACNSSTAPSGSTPASSNPSASTPVSIDPDDTTPVEIRATWWGGTERNAIYQSIVDEFVKTYPHITVTTEPTDWGTYWERLTVQVAGGNAPEFIGMNVSYATEYLGRGACAPLDSFIDQGIIDLSEWEDGVVATGVYDGVSYMIPMGVTFRSTYLNLGVMKELGVTIPDFNWTWDDVKSIGLEVKAAQEARGNNDSWFFQGVCGDWGIFNFYARQHDTSIYDEQGKLGVDAALITKWFTMWKEFQDLGIVADFETGVEYENATLEEGLLSQDRVLTDLNAANQYAAYCATFPDKELTLIRFPSTAGGTDMEYAEGSHFAITSAAPAEKQLAAAMLINFWVNTEAGLSRFLIDQGVPCNQSLLETAVMPNLNDAQNHFVEYVSKVSSLASDPSPIAPLGNEEISTEFTFFAENVLLESMTPAEAAEEFVKSAIDILAKQ